MQRFQPAKVVVLAALSFFFLFAKASATPSFTPEPGIRLSTGVPLAVTIATTSVYRLYFLRDFQVLSATSTDQLTWVEEPGVRLSSATLPALNVSSVTGFSLLTLTGGGYRALYSVTDTTGTYSIFSATSTDGVDWTTESSTRIFSASTTTFLGSPALLNISGDWRIYFVGNTDGGRDPANRQIYTSLSTNEGLNWSTPTVIVADVAGEVCVSTLTSGRVRMIYTAPLSGQTTNTQLLSARASSTGSSFSSESGVRLSTSITAGSLSFPVTTRSTETFRWRVFYGFTAVGSTQTHIYSALTLAPDPQSISPNAVNRTAPAQTFTVGGEIFSPAPSAINITQAGQTDVVGTALAQTSDVAVTATLDTNNINLGLWSVTVTNSDGQSASLANVLSITFESGDVVLTNNLLRPRTSADTQIDVTIYDVGNIRLRLYTLEGKLVRNLYDQTAPIGTTSVTWDGKNDDGNFVASGVYLLKAEGPKLDQKEKIVVIK